MLRRTLLQTHNPTFGLTSKADEGPREPPTSGGRLGTATYRVVWAICFSSVLVLCWFYVGDFSDVAVSVYIEGSYCAGFS